METLSVQRLTRTRIPTVDGEFTLALYENSEDDKDHLALVYGDVGTGEAHEDVLVRVHSECFTGDVLGSLRCDCGEQLRASMRRVAQEGRGIILYLRQEGRGIGLLSKLRAYDLQDEGYDTVEANLMLGHGADERDYTVAAAILRDLDVQSVRLLTNNPEKIESLDRLGVPVSERVPLEPHLNAHNTDYLRTKVERMRHLLDLGPLRSGEQANAHGADLQALQERAVDHFHRTGRPFVTLTYAQSLDGSIAAVPGTPLRISGEESMAMTHELRAVHDAILVGIGTVLADDPRLTARRADGAHPKPVVLDSRLRFPLDARLLTGDGPAPIIATHDDAPTDKQEALEDAGATVLRLECADGGGVCMRALLDALAERRVMSLMVEGGAEVITSALANRVADHLVLTIAPMFLGGVSAVQGDAMAASDPSASGPPFLGASGDGSAASPAFPRLTNMHLQWLGNDLVLSGDPVWDASA